MTTASSDSTTIAPFPWHALPRVSREDAAATRMLRRGLLSPARLRDAEKALSDVVQSPIIVRVDRIVHARGTEAPPRDAVACEITYGDGAEKLPVLLEAEGALAASLVAIALGRRPVRAVQPGRDPPDSVAGAFAAIVYAAARCIGGLRLGSMGAARPLWTDLLGRAGPTVVAELRVHLEGTGYRSRVFIPWQLAVHGLAHAPSPAESLRHDAVRIALPLVVDAALASYRELSTLSIGDVWLGGGLPIGGTGGALRGRGWLAGKNSHAGIAVDIVTTPTPSLIVHRKVEAFVTESIHPGESEPLLQTLAEAPIVVRVELGTVEMTAGEWASLAEGDVVALGQPLGNPVVLRAGSQVLGHGELVRVGDELGIRVLRRISE